MAKVTDRPPAADEIGEPMTRAGLPVVVTLDGLQKEYGKAEGERLYYEIAIKGGFGDVRSVSHDYSPPLGLSGLRGDNLKAVEEVFASAKAAKE